VTSVNLLNTGKSAGGLYEGRATYIMSANDDSPWVVVGVAQSVFSVDIAFCCRRSPCVIYSCSRVECALSLPSCNSIVLGFGFNVMVGDI